MRLLSAFAALTLSLQLAGCGSPPPHIAHLQGADVLLLGEIHDQASHQRQHRDVVQALAARGRLAALVLEMAERGHGTAGLPRSADEDAVRAALRWDDQAWPWASYAPAVMAAVRAGVPVLGANLPRGQMRAAMADGSLEGTLDDGALAAQREAIRAGHCDLLPPQQLLPMVRVQIARDRAMARTVAETAQAGRVVVLLSGAGHADPALGVPRHLPAALVARPVLLERPAGGAARDYCAELREQLQREQ
ncbi:ChaN family lipoprotein [Ramlibacter tataouinensis]|uniref:ChaN family lipoprotein n=1 Tax=Ramlibacter tataouinensis TaxID=94132 RepID=UPI0022F3BE1C|nr:ChaN family lipoprotein [Ramlibacter tataouinensis]WBY00170.1 ChaN family lipoprotein [Ramlibacter tataouinensis]